MATRMQQRRGTASEWALENPILAAGEFGVELDTNKLKCGDGVSFWNDLEYVVGIEGPTGPAGLNGVDGLDGESAYDLAVENGFVGTEQDWLASLQGPQGEAGPTGPTGPAGTDGLDSVASATSPITYDEQTHVIGINQGLISISQTQVQDLEADLDSKLANSNASVSSANTDLTVVRNIKLSTSAPSGGADGDIWLVYTA